jgi:hypothetical protein
VIGLLFTKNVIKRDIILRNVVGSFVAWSMRRMDTHITRWPNQTKPGCWPGWSWSCFFLWHNRCVLIIKQGKNQRLVWSKWLQVLLHQPYYIVV